MTPAASGTLNLSPHLNKTAQQAFLLPQLKTGSLISLGQLCNDDCVALFTKYNVAIVKNNQVLITGQRKSNGLWSLPIPKPPPHQANGILRMDKTKRELAQYHHALLGSPATSTLLRAIHQGHLVLFPGLTTNLISKHLPDSIATALGHQDQEAKNLRSTKYTPPIPIVDLDIAPSHAPRTHLLCLALLPTRNILKSYSDQTGKFPVISSHGNQYLFVLYHYDTNSIPALPLPNRQAASIHKAWEATHQNLLSHRHTTKLHILDNECSHELKAAFEKNNVPFQRVPPKEHRANSAKRAIRTLKNHLVATLSTVDTQFPLAEWDRLLPQIILTLNLLRSSRIHPSLSAHASIYSNFDYNRTPIAPLGTQIVAHTSADSRTSFGPHGRVGWYISPSPEHYCCYKCYFPDTMSETDVLKVTFFPRKKPFPTVTNSNYLRQTADDLLHLLQSKPKPTPHDPTRFGPHIYNAFQDVATILRRSVTTAPNVIHPDPDAPPRVVPTPPTTTTPTPRQQPTPIEPKMLTPLPQRQPQLPSLLHVINSVQHDPTVAGKMFNATTGKAETINTLLAGPDVAIWLKSLSNKIGRCSIGLSKHCSSSDAIVGTNTVFFICPNQVPPGRKVTYSAFVCIMRPNKSEAYRIGLTVGSDKLDAYQDVRSPAVGITDTKLHLNSTISDAHRGARYCTADINNFFLMSEMSIFQYMRIHRRYVTDEIMDEYNLTEDFFDNQGYAYLEIRKGMYGLKEAAILAYKQLREHLATFGYFPFKHTPGLWRHARRKTTFTLAVDDFGIKHFSKSDANHFFHALRDKYEITIDWSGTSYLGLTIDWHYQDQFVNISMPEYVPKPLNKFNHPTPRRSQHAPAPWTKPAYGQKVQYTNTDLTCPLDKAGTQRVQAVSGTFLYYGRAVDPTVLVALNDIAHKQSAPTEQTRSSCNQLLDYLHTHPLATIRYHASNMILSLISDAAHLVLPGARSPCATLFTLTNKSLLSPPQHRPNEPLHVMVKTLRGVPASAAKAETGGIFMGAQEAVPLIHMLIELGHPQPITGTPIETDNSTTHDILTAKVRMKQSKAFDMRYHWIKDRIGCRQFNLFWAPGQPNRGDYFTKHHPPAHH